jgi:hypothetical protein
MTPGHFYAYFHRLHRILPVPKGEAVNLVIIIPWLLGMEEEN